MAETMVPLRHLFTKSVVARTDLLAGTVLRAEHLTVKKPGTGIPAAHLSELLGRTLRCTESPATNVWKRRTWCKRTCTVHRWRGCACLTQRRDVYGV
jgi:hypothetical protein